MTTNHSAAGQPPISPAEIRYIKLGRGGAWARTSIERGEVHFGHDPVAHDLCNWGDWAGAERLLRERAKSAGAAKHALNEIRDFYTLGTDALWITFAEGHLWWTFAGPEIVWIGESAVSSGARMRAALGGWRNTDIQGKPLRIEALSSRLTQVANFRQTICRVKERDYLLRRINAVPDPMVLEGSRVRNEMLAVADMIIRSLHWADFEVMVDIIFAHGGWHRRSVLGESLPDVDLVLEQPTINATASVQVKSKAGQRELDDHVRRFRLNGGHDRTFFVCHSPQGRYPAVTLLCTSGQAGRWRKRRPRPACLIGCWRRQREYRS